MIGDKQWQVKIIRYSGHCWTNDNLGTVLCFSMFDKEKNRDFWTFKPKTWIKLFHEDRDISDGPQIWNEFVWDFECGKLKLPGNIQRQHFVGGSPAKNYKIETYVLYKIVQRGVSEQNIKNISSKLLEVLNSKAGHELYQAQFAETKHTGFKESIKWPNGDYWKNSSLMASKKPTVIECQSLDCIFTSDSIWEIVGRIFGVPNENINDWDDTVKEFAFGESIKEGKSDDDLLVDYASLEIFE
jgi:hypothetical protein